jgi:hypothetical protein
VTVGVECPKCGMSEGYYLFTNSLGYLVGKCYRAKCGHTARVDGRPDLIVPKPATREPRYYTRPMRELTAEQFDLIDTRFGIRPEEIDGYSEADDRFLLPVYGPKGYNRRGYIAYSLSGGTPKTLPYNEKPDEPWVHYAGSQVAGVVIVEDWFSAEKVATAGAKGVAIMGTNLTQEMVTEIAAYAALHPVHIALDRDAYAKTIGYVSRYREQFPLGLYAWSLRVDLKYESTERIKRALDGASNFLEDGNTNSRSNATGAVNA